MTQRIIPAKILVFTAHPDDESYLCAGLLYANSRRGGTNFVVCATLGEKGTSHMQTPVTPARMKKIRRRELNAVSKFLNVSKTFILNLPDGGVKGYKKKLFSQGLKIASTERPDLILSFGPDGITGHFDHVATGQVARKIARLTRTPFAAFSFSPKFLKEAERSLKARRKSPYYIKKINFTKPNLRVPINGTAKKKAIRMHSSQMDKGNPFTGFPKYAVKELLANEYFVI